MGSSTTSAPGTSAAASAWCAERKPRIAGTRAEHLRDVRERRDADAAADDQRARHREVEAVAERAEHVQRAPRPRARRASACRARSGRSGSRAHRPRARQSDIGRGSTCPGGWSMKNWPGMPGLDRARPRRAGACTARPARCRRPAARRRVARARVRHAPVPIRSCSESAVSARAFAIACTAAAAPEIVVMQGTRATSAASRMR